MSKNGVCLNTDGSVRHDDGFFAVGGIVRDHDGKWVDLGYDNVIIQSDCLEAIKERDLTLHRLREFINCCYVLVTR
ncbi:hypothetical protein Goshw_025606, partial [Gossypium schwendimanii]|nr:hypothetical protein [Gossypium schwendimanii]